MDINRLTQILIDNRSLKNQKEILAFENAISRILSLNDLNHIENLCLGFDDATENDEVMFGLIHAVEGYDKVFGSEQSLKKLSESLRYMLPHAKEWAKTFHKRILNHKPSCKIYAKVILQGDVNVRKIVVQLVTEIKERNPTKFGASVDEFISYVSK
ncbi:Imm30 family immunity protein [Aquisalibacillus elongatus]|uniref:Immunity protein 30 of polymorphic toxin system n=1 Tax=Aquisalibacillus elongatus TaxID=485577 RepID=A0A3N5C3W4_9BACI|nr:Imm30 family immunity protein [Aquisalibacillus elongatus]RPF54152.1 immunity protein 30 of polymorphic toxin system [Aquisalibacillus elongatus]